MILPPPSRVSSEGGGKVVVAVVDVVEIYKKIS
jgi:hypothetical protein